MPFIYYKLPCKNKLAKPAVTGQHKHPLIQPTYFNSQGFFQEGENAVEIQINKNFNVLHNIKGSIYLPRV